MIMPKIKLESDDAVRALAEACRDVARVVHPTADDVSVAAYQIGKALGVVSKRINKRTTSKVDQRADAIARKKTRITEHSGVTLKGTYPASYSVAAEHGPNFPIPARGSNATIPSGLFKLRRSAAITAPISYHYKNAPYAQLKAAASQKLRMQKKEFTASKRTLNDLRGAAAKTFGVAAAILHPSAGRAWDGPSWVMKKGKADLSGECSGTRIDNTPGARVLHVVCGNKIANKQNADKIFLTAMERRVQFLLSSMEKSKSSELNSALRKWGGIVVK